MANQRITMEVYGKIFNADFWDEDESLANFVFRALDAAAIREGLNRPSVSSRRDEDMTMAWRDTSK